jgi:predicted Rossmann fold flavoprotein
MCDITSRSSKNDISRLVSVNYDVVIIGGGAAGMFCAIEAGKRGRRVLVIEHNAEVGRKIIISGGGRCNFTNINIQPENFISANPHFAKSALARYTPQDFTELVKKHKITFYEKKLGQLFCCESSRQIVEMLLLECKRARVEVLTQCSVTQIVKDARFTLETNRGKFNCESLVIATGGRSFPKIGATGFGYDVARQFALKMTQTRPSLVALSAGGQFGALAGISVDALVSAGKRSFRENILFTHRGMSGPAILQISNYWQKGVPVEIDLLPEINAVELLLENSSRNDKLGNFLGRFVPERFARAFVSLIVEDRPLSQFSCAELRNVGEHLNSWKVNFVQTEGYDRAEVTLGGVDTGELSSTTMETKKVNGLYFIGEVVDVTGWLGGYNFQWAWASGFAAGQSV